MNLKTYMNEKKSMVDEALKGLFPEAQGPAAELIHAMNYSLFAGGKRLRPILCMAGAEAVGGSGRDMLPVACALELIHTYSLIHDDLPAMDNDDLRRGKPTNHKVFGEALAILAGDGLLTEAFRLMTDMGSQEGMDPLALLKSITLIASAAGCQGMVSGQAADILHEGKEVDLPTVQFIHTHKTGALIRASVTSGAILAGGDGPQTKAISSYGGRIGLAFQIADDILDVEGDSRVLGKGVGGDARKGKITYPGILGLSESKKIQREMIEEALDCLGDFDHGADPLRQIAGYIIERKK